MLSNLTDNEKTKLYTYLKNKYGGWVRSKENYRRLANLEIKLHGDSIYK